MSKGFFPFEMDEFKKYLQEVFEEKIREVVERSKTNELMRTREVCELLGVSEVTLKEWRDRGIIPFKQLGSRIYFDKKEILDAMSQGPNGKGRRKKR